MSIRSGEEPAVSLVDRLALEPDGRGTFGAPVQDERHIFGGRLMAQSLLAATTTVPPSRIAHSVQGSFLHAGDGRIPVRYQVEETREGSSFSTRRVSVLQDGAVLFVAIASFHEPEPGAAYELPSPGAGPGPDGIDFGRYNNPVFESRDVPPGTGPALPPLARRAWFRARLPLPDDPVVHAQAVVYLSDYGATRGVRQPHADHPGLEQRMSVSLNHSVWLHSSARADDWLLSEYYPVATGAGRGLAFGSIRTADGRLVATLAQEALLRIPDPTEPAGD